MQLEKTINPVVQYNGGSIKILLFGTTAINIKMYERLYAIVG